MQNLHFKKKKTTYFCNTTVPSCKPPGVLPALEIPHRTLQGKAAPQLAEHFLQTTPKQTLPHPLCV